MIAIFIFIYLFSVLFVYILHIRPKVEADIYDWMIVFSFPGNAIITLIGLTEILKRFLRK